MAAVLVAAGSLVVAACGDSGDEGASAGTTDTTAPETSSTAVAVGDEDPVAEAYDIGDGVELFLHCEGEGGPTVLLEAGDNAPHDMWKQVDQRLEQQTRVCSYDRQGLGRSSDPTADCRQMDDLVGDLEKLIAAAELEGPFIFMGASGGGFIASEMASRHPDEVAGIVLVETPKALTIVPDELRDVLQCDYPENVEHRDWIAVEHAAWDDREQIGDFPMVIFTNDPQGQGAGDELTNLEDQQGWLVLSPQATQVVVTTGHDVANNEPNLVVDEVTKVIEAARAG